MVVRLQENGEVWVSWFVGYFIRIISSVGYHPKYSERWGVGFRYWRGLYTYNNEHFELFSLAWLFPHWRGFVLLQHAL